LSPDPHEHQPPSQPRRDKRPLEGQWARVAATASVLAVVVAVLALIHWPFGADSREGSLRLESSGSTVTNGIGTYQAVRSGAGVRQTLSSVPTIHLEVFNDGTGTALINRISVEVTAYAHIDECYSQGAGDVPTSTPYAVQLPTLPVSKHPAVVVSNSQKEVRSQSALKLTFRLKTATWPAAFAMVQLYVLRVHLFVDNPSHELTTRSFVVSEPVALSSDELASYLPVDDGTLTQVQEWPGPTGAQMAWCYRQNVASMKRIAGRKAIESASVRATIDASPALLWDRLLRRTAHPTDALALLKGFPWLTDVDVYAARQTNDAGLIERVRERGAANLLATASRFATDPSSAGVVEFEAREASWLYPRTRGESNRLLSELSRLKRSG
jgi:hypothetical protein